MHVAVPQVERRASKVAKNTPGQTIRDYASEEICAYVAARDSLLLEAEAQPNAVTVKRERLANEWVANCLNPAHAPYGSQFLPEQDAARELQGCRDASERIAALAGH